MVVLGLLILILSIVVAIGVISMTANSDATDTLMVFGYNFDLTRAGVFIFGAIVGALALLGLGLILSALRRSSRRHKVAELEHYRYEAESARQERDELLDARERQLQQERELHARHERELREVRETRETNMTPDTAPETRDPVLNETRDPAAEEPRQEPLPRRAHDVESRSAVVDRGDARSDLRRDVDRDDVDRGHQESFWHRIFGSPANRS